jgi:hypothetical protein
LVLEHDHRRNEIDSTVDRIDLGHHILGSPNSPKSPF